MRAMREYAGAQQPSLDEAGQNLSSRSSSTSASRRTRRTVCVVPVIQGADKLDIFESRNRSASSRARRATASYPAPTCRARASRSEPRRNRRHVVHADHQLARGRDPRRVASRDAAHLGRQGVPAAADAAAFVLLRSPRHRRREGRALRQVARETLAEPGGSSGRFREQDRPEVRFPTSATSTRST